MRFQKKRARVTSSAYVTTPFRSRYCLCPFPGAPARVGTMASCVASPFASSLPARDAATGPSRYHSPRAETTSPARRRHVRCLASSHRVRAVHESYDMGSYDPEMDGYAPPEISLKSLRLGEKIGEGSFSEVYRGEIEEVEDDDASSSSSGGKTSSKKKKKSSSRRIRKTYEEETGSASTWTNAPRYGV